MPAAPARMRSAIVPCGRISSSISPRAKTSSNSTEPRLRAKLHTILRTRPSPISRATPSRPRPAVLWTTVSSLAPVSMRPSIKALGSPTWAKPAISTVEPSLMPASASATERTNLSIMRAPRFPLLQPDLIGSAAGGEHPKGALALLLLRLDKSAQHGVDAGLVAAPALPEPGENVAVEPQGHRLLALRK